MGDRNRELGSSWALIEGGSKIRPLGLIGNRNDKRAREVDENTNVSRHGKVTDRLFPFEANSAPLNAPCHGCKQ